LVDELAYVRPCVPSDDPFLYDVFASTWQSEVATLPNQNLAQHVLRIQHIAQERRFASSHPGYQRYLVLADGHPAGRLYLQEQGLTLHIVDLTLMPQFRSRGIGTMLFRDLFALAIRQSRSISTRVDRSNRRATDLHASLGFRLVAVDDLDHHFEWTPVQSPVRPQIGTQPGPLGGALVDDEQAAPLTNEAESR
jgi:ribosomal protein S18 acetylase RimI-like enzyme